jgi:hypothetical protein
MISLLKIFLKENNLFCKPVNFFQKNEKAEIKWSERLKKYKGLKVGINSSTSHRVRKDIPMKYFAQLASSFDFKFIVIQKEVSKNELKEISNKKNILHFPDLDSSKQAFIDSIEIIKNLDLVITADTATAHLSATLGKKTWILLPFVADWRWFLDESKSKWYENVVLYRSKKIDDWDSPFKMIEKDLKKDFC